MTTFVALGDSITVGMGDPAPEGGWRGWAALLAATLPSPISTISPPWARRRWTSSGSSCLPRRP